MLVALNSGISCDKCTESYKLERGCNVPAQSPFKDVTDPRGISIIHRCPLLIYKNNPSQCNEILKYHSWYKKGFLAVEGTWGDQPAPFTIYMEIVDRAYALVEKYQAASVA